MVGYSPADVMSGVEGTKFSHYASSTISALTKAMILHPIAAGFCFIAFMLSLGVSFAGSLLASMVALLTFLITVVATILDFVLFSIVKSNVNDDESGSSAYYAAAAWTILVSAVCSLLGAIIVFLTCCSGRLHRRSRVSKVDPVDPPPLPRWV
jgi:hypothetical protein